MKKTILIMFVIAVLGIAAGCTGSTGGEEKQEMKEDYQRITAEEAYKMMSEEEVTVVDVRRKDEYDSGHIKNAVLIPNESISDTEPEELPDKDAIILIYCRSGNRSRDAAGKLADMGYSSIYEFGGINSWPYEITKE